MPLRDIGTRGYHYGVGVATLTLTPQSDRAAVIRRILIDKPSAGDIWRPVVAGRELPGFDIQTFGNQQPLAGPYSGYPKNNDLFDIYENTYNEPLIYPVPMGESFVISSDGGATANITIEYEEVAPAELSPGMMNHPNGNRFVGLLVGYRGATAAAVGEVAFDSQVGPKWFPNLFVDNDIPTNWRMRVTKMFLEGGGRNTYSGTADHQSTSIYLAVIKNGQRLFTRDALGGIPLIGQASATGSANTVVGTDQTPMPPIQESDFFDFSSYIGPLDFGGGDSYQLRLGLTGDVTGGADYSHMRQAFLVDTRTP